MLLFYAYIYYIKKYILHFFYTIFPAIYFSQILTLFTYHRRHWIPPRCSPHAWRWYAPGWFVFYKTIFLWRKRYIKQKNTTIFMDFLTFFTYHRTHWAPPHCTQHAWRWYAPGWSCPNQGGRTAARTSGRGARPSPSRPAAPSAAWRPGRTGTFRLKKIQSKIWIQIELKRLKIFHLTKIQVLSATLRPGTTAISHLTKIQSKI